MFLFDRDPDEAIFSLSLLMIDDVQGDVSFMRIPTCEHLSSHSPDMEENRSSLLGRELREQSSV